MKTLDDLLADTGRVNDLDAEAFQGARASLNEAVSTPVSSAVSATPGRASWGRHRTLVLAGGTAAAVAALITVPVVGIGGSGPHGRADAAPLLREAGRAAGAQPGGWPDAPYWHVASSYVRNGQTYQRDIWVAHHGQSVLHDTGLPGDPGFLPIGAGIFGAGGTTLTWDELYALPTDPDQLAATLQADVHGFGPNDETELFVAVGDLLRETPAPPELREALYDVAADIPGVQVTGQVTDPEGRTGTAVELDGETYVIDTSNGQLLSETEEGFTSTYLNQGPADDAPPA
jgi:hypothetical protein